MPLYFLGEETPELTYEALSQIGEAGLNSVCYYNGSEHTLDANHS